MQFIFNPKKIKEVGVRIFVEGELKKEVILKHNKKFPIVEEAVRGSSEVQIELVEASRIKNPQEAQYAELTEIKDIFPDNEPFKMGITALGYKYPYKTVFPEIGENIEAIYLDFVQLEDLDCTAVIAKAVVVDGSIEECKERQLLVRLPGIKSIKRRRFVMMIFVVMLYAIMALVTLYLLFKVLTGNITNTFDGKSKLAFVEIVALLLHIPGYIVYSFVRSTYEVLLKCEMVSAYDYKEEFVSEYLNSQMVDENEDDNDNEGDS